MFRFDRIQKTILIIYSSILLLGLTYLFAIKNTGLMIPCVFYLVTGLKCPGCGLTHMFLNLLNGNIYEAFVCNPFMFILICVWFIISVLLLFKSCRRLINQHVLYLLLWISVIGGLLFSIIRNLI